MMFQTHSRLLPVSLLAVLLLAVLPFFFIGGPDWSASPLYRAMWNLGHILFFAFLTLGVLVYSGRGGWWQVLAISTGVFLLGLGIEYLQAFSGRQPDWGDVLRNLIGAWLVLAWRHPFSRPGPAVWLGRVAVAALVVVQLLPVAETIIQRWRITDQLPLLSDFKDERSLAQWSGDVTLMPRRTTAVGASLLINLDTGRYSGAGMDIVAADWSGYQHLGIELYNPGSEPLSLTLRINDLQHDRGSYAYSDRYNRQLLALPGWNRYRIDLADIAAAPATRTMDMQKIRRLGLFASHLQQPRSLYLTRLQLE